MNILLILHINFRQLLCSKLWSQFSILDVEIAFKPRRQQHSLLHSSQLNSTQLNSAESFRFLSVHAISLSFFSSGSLSFSSFFSFHVNLCNTFSTLTTNVFILVYIMHRYRILTPFSFCFCFLLTLSTLCILHQGQQIFIFLSYCCFYHYLVQCVYDNIYGISRKIVRFFFSFGSSMFRLIVSMMWVYSILVYVNALLHMFSFFLGCTSHSVLGYAMC